MIGKRFWAWLAVAVSTFYFIMPLVATLEFSMRMRRNLFRASTHCDI